MPPPFGSGYDGLLLLINRELVASIVPPPFGSGYGGKAAAVGEARQYASIVPPPFGSGYDSPVGASQSDRRSFNRAAPFRERLSAHRRPSSPTARRLQSCRPLSGAVIGHPGLAPLGWPVLQSCRPLSGAVIEPAVVLNSSIWCFNRAAPFRERLFESTPNAAGAVYELQSCRPLSGAVMWVAWEVAEVAEIASIVPPPFGSGYVSLKTRLII